MFWKKKVKEEEPTLPSVEWAIMKTEVMRNKNRDEDFNLIKKRCISMIRNSIDNGKFSVNIYQDEYTNSRMKIAYAYIWLKHNGYKIKKIYMPYVILGSYDQYGRKLDDTSNSDIRHKVGLEISWRRK